MEPLLCQELWKGGIQHWSGVQTMMLLVSFIIFPPVWLIFSLPLNNKYNKTPIVKFSCYLTSHIFFMIFQVQFIKQRDRFLLSSPLSY